MRAPLLPLTQAQPLSWAVDCVQSASAACTQAPSDPDTWEGCSFWDTSQVGIPGHLRGGQRDSVMWVQLQLLRAITGQMHFAAQHAPSRCSLLYLTVPPHTAGIDQPTGSISRFLLQYLSAQSISQSTLLSAVPFYTYSIYLCCFHCSHRYTFFWGISLFSPALPDPSSVQCIAGGGNTALAGPNRYSPHKVMGDTSVWCTRGWAQPSTGGASTLGCTKQRGCSP